MTKTKATTESRVTTNGKMKTSTRTTEVMEKVMTVLKDLDLEFVMVDTDKLKPCWFNPPTRTDNNKSAFKNLRANIAKYGIQTPLEVTSDYVIVNGNRRFKSALATRLNKVPCLVRRNLKSTHPAFKILFCILNKDTRAIAGSEWGHLWLKGDEVLTMGIPTQVNTSYTNLSKIAGRGFITTFVKKGKSHSTFSAAFSMLKNYVPDRSDDMFMKQTAYWMLNVGSAYKLKNAIWEYVPTGILIECIEERKPLPVHWK